MNNKVEERIEDYLQGKLTPEDSFQFREELKIDKELRDKVYVNGLVNNLILEKRLLDVRASCREVAKVQDKNTKIQRWLTIIALLIISAVITSIILKTYKSGFKNKKNVDQVKEKHIIPSVKKENKNKVLEEIKVGQVPVKVHSKKPKNIVGRRDATISSLPPEPFPVNTGPVNSSKDSAISDITLAPEIANDPVFEKDLCIGVTPTAEIQIHSPCAGQKDGKLEFVNFTGGTGPYTYKVLDGEKNITDPSSLSEGTYKVYLTDSRGCKGVPFTSVIKATICNKDYIFNPSAGETWIVPASQSSGFLKIYNKAGEVVYESILTSVESVWNGQNIKNGMVDKGFYIYEISYNNGTYIKGSVTIVE